MKKVLAVLLAAIMCFALVACGGNEEPGNNPSGSDVVETKELFKGVTSTDLDGNEIDDSVFKGKKLTMVNIWGTFCRPCIGEMPDLQKISEEYKDKDLQIIGMVCDIENKDDIVMIETAKEIVADIGVKYQNIVPSDSLNTAFLDSVTLVPLTLFLDENGEQIASYEGSRSYEGWTAIIDELLAPAE